MSERTLDEIIEEVKALPDRTVITWHETGLPAQVNLITADIKRLANAIEIMNEDAAHKPGYRPPEYLDPETKRRRGIERGERVVR